MIYDVIIIGGGPGGYTAAIYASRAGLNALVIEKLAPGGQMSTTGIIENYPGFDDINGFELALKMKASAEKFGTTTVMADVINVDFESKIKKIITRDNVYEGKTVIIATGAEPRELGLDNERELRGRGVSYCATCDGMLYRNKTVVVVGGGNSAAVDVVFLSKICKKVILIHRKDHLTASRVYNKALGNADNVEIMWNTEVIRLIAEDKLKSVEVKNNIGGEQSIIPCDGIFIAIGRLPNTKLFENSIALDNLGYIAATETTQTNVDGIFAIGDVRAKPLRQIVTAAADGAVATKFIEDYLAEQEQ